MTLTARQRLHLLRFAIAGAVPAIASFAVLVLWMPEVWAEFLGAVLGMASSMMLGGVLAVIVSDRLPRGS